MRLLFCTSLLLLLGWLAVVRTVDIEMRLNEVLSNQTTVENYCKCFLEKGPCNQEARTLKRMLPEFIATRCGKCTEKQKKGACRIIKTLQQDKYRDYWNGLMAKYDRQEIHRQGLDVFMRNCPDELHVID